MGVSGEAFAIITLNPKATAKYHNDELEKSTITASVLTSRPRADRVDRERSIKDDTVGKCGAYMQAAESFPYARQIHQPTPPGKPHGASR
jgi:hypothetical protein